MRVLEQLPDDPQMNEIRESLHLAVTELQFHDMASQLLVHTGKVLKGCAYNLADEAMEPEEDEVGVVVTHMPEPQPRDPRRDGRRFHRAVFLPIER
jgi:hypothetical protein